MPAFLAALGPLAAKLGAGATKGLGFLGKGASKIGGGSMKALDFLKNNKQAQQGLLGFLGGGLTQQFGGDEANDKFLQMLMAQQATKQNKIGSDELPTSPTTIIN